MGGFFYWKNFCRAGENDILINEIQISGGSGKTAEDYVELYNKSDAPLKIGNWKIRKRVQSGNESSIKVFSDSAIIPSKGYFLWANNDLAEKIKADESTSSTIAANNSLALLNDDGEIIDQVAWGNGHTNPFIEGMAFIIPAGQPERIERKNFQDTGSNHEDFKIISEGSPTPSGCLKNPEKCSPQNEEKTNLSDDILITELLPNPSNGQEEYIELYNGANADLALDDWSLHDASQSGEYVFSEADSLKTKEYFVIYKNTFGFALNNSGDETITLFDPNKKEVSKVSYKSSKKGASYNFNGQKWRWSKFLTPGKENVFNNEPYGNLKIDKDVFANVYANFSVSTGDADGDKISVTWDFGDGHKSYLKKTRHKYEEEGKYAGSVKLSDGSEDTLKNFTIKVRELPHPKVRIVAINANPKGKDNEAETITLLNKSKKKINLIGWSVATGWKKLYNHPIGEDFEIKAGQEKELTREFSKFTLNNQKSKIELRYPDGETAHDIKYKKDSVKEGEVYAKINSTWQWIAPSAPKEKESSDQKELETKPEVLEVPLKTGLNPSKIPEEILGKFSVKEKHLTKQTVESLLLGFTDSKFNPNFTQRYALASQPFVLGISGTKNSGPSPRMTQMPRLNNLSLRINLFLNKLILKFFNSPTNLFFLETKQF